MLSRDIIIFKKLEVVNFHKPGPMDVPNDSKWAVFAKHSCGMLWPFIKPIKYQCCSLMLNVAFFIHSISGAISVLSSWCFGPLLHISTLWCGGPKSQRVMCHAYFKTMGAMKNAYFNQNNIHVIPKLY